MSEQEQPLYTQEQVESLIQERLEATQQNSDRYDNEMLKLFRTICKNQSIADIEDFIKKTKWTDKQVQAMTAYARVVLSDSNSTTYFRNYLDYKMFYDDVAMVEIDLPLDLTIFDVDKNYNILKDFVNLQVGIESRKSIGGKLINSMKTQRHEFDHSESVREKEMGFVDKVKSKFGG